MIPNKKLGAVLSETDQIAKMMAEMNDQGPVDEPMVILTGHTPGKLILPPPPPGLVPEPVEDKRITMRALRALPIPSAVKPNVIRFRKTPRQEGKLHCIHCGKKHANMKLATSIMEPDGTITLIYLNLQKTLRALRDPSFALPKTMIGNCFICKGNTYYTMTKNRKLQVETR